MHISDITVIVSVEDEDEEKYIPQFIASLPTEVQLLLVNVRSEETAEMVMKLRKENTEILRYQPRIREARNYASVQVKTRWILFTQARVAFAPDYFSHLAASQPKGAVYGMQQANRERHAFFHWRLWSDRLGIPMVSKASFLVEKYIFQAVGGFDPQLPANEDIKIGLQIKRAGYPIRLDPRLRSWVSDQSSARENRTHQDLLVAVQGTRILLTGFVNSFTTKVRGILSAASGD